MPSRPASQLADDGEAVGTPVPAAYDPSSAEPPVTHGGARKSVAPAPDGREANEVPRKDDTTATFSLRLERAKWAENFFRLMDGILDIGHAVTADLDLAS